MKNCEQHPSDMVFDGSISFRSEPTPTTRPTIRAVYYWFVALFVLAVVIGWSILFMYSAKAESGTASVYGSGDGYAGRKTASGERMNPHALTAAHRTLPFGTRVTVTNRSNGRSVSVRISDRGPFIRGRIIDLSPAGARALGFSGLAPVTVTR